VIREIQDENEEENNQPKDVNMDVAEEKEDKNVSNQKGKRKIEEPEPESTEVRRSRRITEKKDTKEEVIAKIHIPHVVEVHKPKAPLIPSDSVSNFPAFLGTYCIKGIVLPTHAKETWKLLPLFQKRKKLPVQFCCTQFWQTSILLIGTPEKPVLDRQDTESVIDHYRVQGWQQNEIATFSNNTFRLILELKRARYFTMTPFVILGNKHQIDNNLDTIDLLIDISLNANACQYHGDAFLNRQTNRFEGSLKQFLTSWLAKDPAGDLPAPKIGPDSDSYYYETLRQRVKSRMKKEEKSGKFKKRGSFIEGELEFELNEELRSPPRNSNDSLNGSSSSSSSSNVYSNNSDHATNSSSSTPVLNHNLSMVRIIIFWV